MGVIEKKMNISAEDFWRAVKIYHDQPKSINKQILHAENLCVFKLNQQLSEEELSSFHNKLFEHKIINEEVIKNFLGFLSYDIIEVEGEIFNKPTGIFLSVRKIIPKSPDHCLNLYYEFCCLNLPSFRADFLTYHVDNSAKEEEKSKRLDPLTVLKYKRLTIEYLENNLILKYNDDMTEKGLNWIKLFLEKFEKIMQNNLNLNSQSHLKFETVVPPVNYYNLYERMKVKYGKYLVDNWPENTDPKKFVYEDIGIASYLMLLWNKGEVPDEKSKKMKFVDLGCGNGLLVYILNSEGHEGVGLDLRKRKIWDLYPPSTKLSVETIIPSSTCVYPEADWLIGNHSDELTAWIPIMANRSNSFCQYFVLPCCPYKLNGEKYQRKNSGLSSYQDFMSYVEKISEICGFETIFDKLRIPSTKRICLIGFRNKNFDSDEILDLISRECDKRFEPRDSIEPVRNCTKLPKNIVDDILILVLKKLLSSENFIPVEGNKKWNLGGESSINDLAKCLSPEQLKILKQECKGLQTLLKNNHYVFQVNQGCVRLRHPNSMIEISNNILTKGMKWKMKNCWFYHNHPDGCPLGNEICSYKHEN